MSRLPLAPGHQRYGNHCHAAPFKRALDGLPIQVCPHGLGLSVNHGENVPQQPEDLEGEGLAVYHGVEPDPRAALDSEGDEYWPAGDGVVDDVVEPEHAGRVGAGLTLPLQAHD